MSELSRLRDRRQRLKSEKTELETQISVVNKLILDELAILGEEEITEGELTTRRVQKHRKRYNEEGIRAKIGQVRWNQITRRVLVEDLLTDAIISGKIDAADIAPFVEEEPWGEPYVEVRKAKREEDGE